jgi:serine protease AprX
MSIEKISFSPRSHESVIIELSPLYWGGVEAAFAVVLRSLASLTCLEAVQRFDGVPDSLGDRSHYVVAEVPHQGIEELCRLSGSRNGEPALAAIRGLWPDTGVCALINRSVATVKATEGRSQYGADGKSIVWAVVDSGIDGEHRHFQKYNNLTPPQGLTHEDFTSENHCSPLTDESGHGTLVAGLIAGELISEIIVVEQVENEDGQLILQAVSANFLSGVAPACKLISLKVLEASGQGKVSSAIKALKHISNMNSESLRVHGANLSLSYSFDVSKYPCGRSPICREVDRLVESGVVIVVAAGDYGYEASRAGDDQLVRAVSASIRDPGNAELAITVGATHSTMPELYGVSPFSSKGPTIDGRPKPDLVAPGDRVVSCAAGQSKMRVAADLAKAGIDSVVGFEYIEASGTSLAAAHVSGTAAAYLSAERNRIGRPKQVKEILLNSALNLKRDSCYQGRGLVNLTKALELSGRPYDLMESRQSLTPSSALKLMFCYSHEDGASMQELEVFLAPLKREGLIQVWHDRKIPPGGEWNREIEATLDAADIIVLLVTAKFIASEYIWEVELQRAMQRHNTHKACVIPVIVRHCLWKTTLLGKLQALPSGTKPVKSWHRTDAAWTDVVDGIRRVAEGFRSPA